MKEKEIFDLYGREEECGQSEWVESSGSQVEKDSWKQWWVFPIEGKGWLGIRHFHCLMAERSRKRSNSSKTASCVPFLCFFLSFAFVGFPMMVCWRLVAEYLHPLLLLLFFLLMLLMLALLSLVFLFLKICCVHGLCVEWKSKGIDWKSGKFYSFECSGLLFNSCSDCWGHPSFSSFFSPSNLIIIISWVFYFILLNFGA